VAHGEADLMRAPVASGAGLRGAQLAAGCVLLGLGSGLSLRAALGSDGWSTMIAGVSRTLDVPYAPTNWTFAALLVTLAWLRGQRPGAGTIVQPLIVGTTANIVLDTVSRPHALLDRSLLLALAMTLMATGIAVYLGAALGAGAVEAGARAFDPPISFRLAYSLIQATGAIVGWRTGAPIGVGTLLVVFGLGPVVHVLIERVPLLQRGPRAGDEGAG
jgi:uncharacterized membrane protein YczE